MTSKSPIITDPDWLHNAHAGEMLLSEFMEPLDLSVEQIAALIAVPVDRLAAVISGERAMDGELDLRLGRYFGMSEGFFLRLQDQYELLEAKRALKDDLDRIVPRAA
ncbi:addiction module antidote protein, HigA family [Sphingobium amiense]|uniref:Addiction module antidote protein, HigA family n=1 Tax=Sphingobium amiense TaxID=135719 RepID=A0A494WEP2_9SPHN|nr:HigA family addiction module antitoxin [Sphingobium amiense]BBD99262.1 addiction module antidote protein, HigA family [Sphingobium amiense]